MINEFNVGETFKDLIVYCVSKQTKVAKNGSSYYDLTLQDKTGQINAKVWEINSVNYFEEKSFIKISGSVSTFNNNLQLSITSVEVIDKTMVNMIDFCPIAPVDINEMYEELMSFIFDIENEYLSKLLKNLFSNEKFVAKFKKSSAAKTVHHAYIGGLLEHTLYVTRNCNYIAQLYPTINKDLLLTAAICHDIGKVKELDEFPDNDYTDIGKLLGHIYIGTEMIDIQARKIDGFPITLLNELKHCILAHHGKLEFGSPVQPELIEALVLNYADDMDAKLRRFSDALDDLSGTWSDKADMFIGSKFRKTSV